MMESLPLPPHSLMSSLMGADDDYPSSPRLQEVSGYHSQKIGSAPPSPQPHLLEEGPCLASGMLQCKIDKLSDFAALQA